MGNALNDVTWDSTCVACWFGSTKVQPTSFEAPDVETKTEKVPRVGEQLATKRTVGRMEIGKLKVEFDLADYTSVILPVMPVMGGSLTELNITARVKHPTVKGAYSLLLERCRIVKRGGPKFDESSKGLVKTLEIEPMRVWEKQEGGQYVTEANLSGSLPMSALALSISVSF